MTVFITILLTLYVLGLILFGFGAYVYMIDGMNPQLKPRPIGAILFVIFWPITIPYWCFFESGN